jgi:hypothetical protein
MTIPDKRIISFDVGIKNMAYCIFTATATPPSVVSVVEWKTINLMNSEDTEKLPSFKCSCDIQRRKKGMVKCEKVAIYKKSADPDEPALFFCKKHATAMTTETEGIIPPPFLLPSNTYKSSSLTKLSLDELNQWKQKYNIVADPATTSKKGKLVECLVSFFNEKTLEPIVHKKQKNSKETDLISIGGNMRLELNKIADFELLTDVIIENQISTIAARMNTIQGMLVQYFIMRRGDGPPLHIEFISSSNKLKGMPTQPTTEPSTTTSAKYKQHKKDGLVHCQAFLEKNRHLTQWKYVLDTRKKDDYADCFLQGVWYLKHTGVLQKTEDYLFV